MLSRRSALAAAALLLPTTPERIVVARGMLTFGAIRVRCSVGVHGVRADKREGDGATPAGVFALREVLYRPDRGPRPATGLPISAIAAADGWSDDPADPEYNRRVSLPHGFHCEALWRRDALYDVLAVIGANDDPVVAGRGSAIFLHVASRDYGGTDGCVALARPDLLRVLGRCRPDTEIEIADSYSGMRGSGTPPAGKG